MIDPPSEPPKDGPKVPVENAGNSGAMQELDGTGTKVLQKPREKKNKPTTVGGSSFPKHPKLLLIVCYSNGTFPMKQPRRFSLGVYPVPINFIQFLDNFKTIPNPIFDIIMHYPFVLGAAASTYKERMTIKYRILGAKTHQMTKPNQDSRSFSQAAMFFGHSGLVEILEAG